MCPGGSVGRRCNSAAPPPPPPPSASDHCSYHLFQVNPKSWVEAEADCVRAGGHLASIHSAEQNAQIDALLEYVSCPLALCLIIRDDIAV